MTVREIIEDGARLEIPMSYEVLAKAQRVAGGGVKNYAFDLDAPATPVKRAVRRKMP